MARWSLGLCVLSAACVRPTAVEWPTAERGQALVSALIGDQGIVAGPWAGLPEVASLVVTDDQRWLISEYRMSFDDLQLGPPLLPLAKVETTSAGRTLAVEGLAPPARTWRSAAPEGDFVEGPSKVLPAEFYQVWAQDLACPHFEPHLAQLPSPIRILLRLDGRSALGISQEGGHYLVTPSQISPLIVEGWPGGEAAFGVHLEAGRLALGTFQGGVVRGTIVDRTVHYEAPVRPFDDEQSPEIRAITGAPDGERLVVAGRHGAVAIIQGQTSTVVHHLIPPGHELPHQRLAWTEEGEVLGLYREPDLAYTGVWRLTFEPKPQVATELFGASSSDTPNEIALIQGEWTIAGTQRELRDRQELFRNRGQGWERFASLGATLRVEGLANAPTWDGLVYSTRNGVRIGAQARLGRGRACPDLSFGPQQVGGGDVIGVVVLDDGRVIAALENLDQVLILRPHRPWFGR